MSVRCPHGAEVHIGCHGPWTAPGPPPADRRECYVGSPGFFLLNHAGLILREAFGTTAYLVGSATERKDWRDVDVRVLLDDDEWQRLFPGMAGNPRTHALWSLLCSATSEHLSRITGLPIDFQVQRQGDANERYARHGGHHRIPLGIYVGTAS